MDTSSYRYMPELTPQSIFFPYDEKEQRYRGSFYEEGMTYGQVSKQEVNSFLANLSKFSSSTLMEFGSYPKFVLTMLGSALASLVLGCFLIFYGRYYTISRAFTLFGLFLIVAGIYLGYRAVNKFVENQEELMQQTKGQITSYFDRNSEEFKNKHLMWKVPEEHFDWVELTVIPSMKSKSLFSEKETAIGDSTLKPSGSIMDFGGQEKSLLTNLI